VTLIAHSLGGIVSRYYLESDLFGGDVDQFISYGSPHLGLPNEFAFVLALLNPNLAASLSEAAALHPGLFGALPAGMRHWNDTHKPRASVGYSLIGGRPGTFPSSYFIWGHDDGVIAFDSATGRSSDTFPAGGNLRRWAVDDGHANILGGLIFDSYDESLDTLGCIVRALRLANAPPQGTCLSVDPGSSRPLSAPRQQQPLQAPDAPRALSPLEAGHLNAGATARLPFTVEGARAAVFLGWTAGDIDFALLAPGGGRITRGNVSVRYPGSSYRQFQAPGSGQLVAAFDLVDPPGGAWSAELSAVDASGDYSLFTTLESEVTVDVGQPQSTGPSGRVTLRTRLHEHDVPLSGASVSAEVLSTSTTGLIALTARANGEFEGQLVAPAKEGVYLIRVRATGQGSAGVFAHEVMRSVAVVVSEPKAIYLPLVVDGGQWIPTTALPPIPSASPTTQGAIGADNATRLQLQSTFSEQGFIQAVAFEDSGDIAAWGGYSGARVMDLLRGQSVRQILAHNGSVQTVAFGSRTSWLYTAGVDADGGRARIWDWAENREVQSIACTVPGFGAFVTLSPAEKWLSCGGGGRPVFQIWQRNGAMWDLASDIRSGAWLLWLGDERILYWDDEKSGWQIAVVPDGIPMSQLPAIPRPTGFDAITSDGKLLAVSNGTEVGMWHFPGGILKAQLTEHAATVRSGKFSPNDEVLASGDANGTVLLWRVSDGALLRTLSEHKRKVNDIAFSSNGTRMATVDEGGSVVIWSIP